jgi:hypothetical protein
VLAALIDERVPPTIHPPMPPPTPRPGSHRGAKHEAKEFASALCGIPIRAKKSGMTSARMCATSSRCVRAF